MQLRRSARPLAPFNPPNRLRGPTQGVPPAVAARASTHWHPHGLSLPLPLGTPICSTPECPVGEGPWQDYPPIRGSEERSAAAQMKKLSPSFKHVEVLYNGSRSAKSKGRFLSQQLDRFICNIWKSLRFISLDFHCILRTSVPSSLKAPWLTLKHPI